MSIATNIQQLRGRIAAAAVRAGRDPREVSLMAVTKTASPERIREAFAAGLRLFGENRVQEFAGKAKVLGELSDAEWHMIGHLQTNKTLKAAELFSEIDSVDSLRLAEKLNASARGMGKEVAVLIEINVGGERAKTGVMAESDELQRILTVAPELQNLKVRGLMTVPPFSASPEDARPYFRKLRELRERISTLRLPAVSMNILSMGMSHDFEVAVEEGSTCVRIGTAIFGDRLSA